MTRQEAINSLREDIHAYVLCGKEKEKHEMAIAALENENALIDQILESIDEVKSDANSGYMFDMVDEIRNRVLALKGGNKYGKDQEQL